MNSWKNWINTLPWKNWAIGVGVLLAAVGVLALVSIGTGIYEEKTTPTLTATPEPTATPDTRGTGFRSAAQRPAPFNGSKTLSLPAGDYGYTSVRAPRAGYLEYSWRSVELNNEGEELDVVFGMSGHAGTLKRTRSTGGMQVSRGETVTFHFSNEHSLFAGKKVYLTYSLR